MYKRVLVSLAFGVGVGWPLFEAACRPDSPGGIEVIGAEWAVILYSALAAAYANFKSNTTVISPNRKVWTEEERRSDKAVSDTWDGIK